MLRPLTPVEEPAGPAAPLRVLFLCTGNSARSQIAEALLRASSKGRIEVVSAGSHPRTEIHPGARAALKTVAGLEMEGQRPKRVEDFVGQHFDYVISVCDRAAETCPVFPGDPERIRWSLEDPAEVDGGGERQARAFERTVKDLTARIRLWMSLPAVAGRLRSVEGGSGRS